MPTEPSGVDVYSPKIRDSALARKFVSLGGTGYVAIGINVGSTPTDPDDGTLQLDVWFKDPLVDSGTNPYGTKILTVTEDSITRDDAGKFHVNMGPEVTGSRGLLTAIWTYQISGVSYMFTDHLQVLDQMPLYDTLSDQEKHTVEQVTWMFADLYDSAEGGPHFQDEFQSHWGYERIAQMMQIATMKMNFIGNFNNPPTTWTVGNASSSSSSSSDAFEVTRPDGSVILMYTNSSSSSRGGEVPANLNGLVVWGAYIECMRHFRDVYTEIPARPGMDAVYTDRRDYWSRWQTNLQQEEQQWRSAVKSAKLGLLGGMSKGSLLVAGGIYGGSAYGAFFRSGMYAAQTRAFRFYPAMPAMSWGAVAH